MSLQTINKQVASTVLLRRAGEDETCEVRVVHEDKVRAGLSALLPAEEYEALSATFRALADPTRARIVYSLLHQELCTCDLAAIAGISEPAVSQHLKVLRKLRLIKSRREGKVVYHSPDDEHIATLLAICLEHVRDAQANMPPAD